MKNKFYLIAILIFSVFVFTGCQKVQIGTLNTPKITNIEIVETSGQYNIEIEFEKVENAVGYQFLIDNSLLYDINSTTDVIVRYENGFYYCTTTKLTYLFSTYKTYDVKIKAVSDGSYKNSEFSSSYTFNNEENINIPTIQLNENIVSWNPIANSIYYVVNIKSLGTNNITYSEMSYKTFDLSFDLSQIIDAVGSYEITVQSAQVNEDTVVLSNKQLLPLTYTISGTLKTPENVEIYQDDEGNVYLNSIVDRNATGINIICNSENYKIIGNIYEEKLNSVREFFTICLTDIVDLKNTQTFEITLLSLGDNKYYLDSNSTNKLSYTKTTVLNSPNLLLTENENNIVITFEHDNLIDINGYNVFVVSQDSTIKSYFVTSDEFVISKAELSPNSYIVANIEGFGNYKTSNLSEPIYLPQTSNTSFEIKYDNSTNTISWLTINNATKYSLQVDDEIVEIDSSIITSSNENSSLQLNLLKGSHNIKLLVNTSDGLLFSNYLKVNVKAFLQDVRNVRVVTTNTDAIVYFDEVANAYAYSIYLKNDTEWTLICTTQNTQVGILKYLNDTIFEHTIFVQAVSYPNSNYVDSKIPDLDDSSSNSIASFNTTKKLATPTDLKINRQYSLTGELISVKLTFNKLQDISYTILLDNLILTSDYTSSSTMGEFELLEFLTESKTYSVKVKANAPEESNYTDSNYAELIGGLTYKAQLSPVSNVIISKNNDEYFINFSSQDKADYYIVTITKQDDDSYIEYVTTFYNKANLSEYIRLAGTYNFTVQAFTDDNSMLASLIIDISKTNYSKIESLNYVKYQNVVTPTIISDEFYLEFDKIENASAYDIYINNELYHIELNSDSPENPYFDYLDTSTDKNILNLSEIIYEENIYSFKVKAIGDGEIYESSRVSDSISAKYSWNNISDFEKNTFNIYNQYNYVINDFEQFKNMIWYNYIYYTDIKFQTYSLKFYLSDETVTKLLEEFNALTNQNLTLKTGDNEQGLTYSEIIRIMVCYCFDIYPDFVSLARLDSLTNALDYYEYALDYLDASSENYNSTISNVTKDGNIYYLCYKNNLNYNKSFYDQTEFNITKNVGLSQNYINQLNLPEDIDLTDIESVNIALQGKIDESMFVLDSAETKLTVYTSTQLLLAIESGYCPQFTMDSDIAETIYSNMKIILASIIDSSMSEYEKVKAIYDWAYYNYKCNQNLVNAINANFDGEIFGNFAEFYLDSYFYTDNINTLLNPKFSTSLGVAKTITALCKMIGIDAITVYGEYKSENDELFKIYCWNKVMVNGIWYNIDVANAGFGIGETGNEVKSYSKFLVSDETLNNYTSNNLKYIESYSIKKVETSKTDYTYPIEYTLINGITDVENTFNALKSSITNGIIENQGYLQFEFKNETSLSNISNILNNLLSDFRDIGSNTGNYAVSYTIKEILSTDNKIGYLIIYITKNQ